VKENMDWVRNALRRDLDIIDEGSNSMRDDGT
jgi:hypothetical protein